MAGDLGYSGQVPAVSQNSSARAAAGPLGIEACFRAIDRIEQVVEQETLALKGNITAGLAEFSRRKSHGLLELTRGLRGLSDEQARRAVEQRLRPLRARLAENSAALQRHLGAVQDVTAILARAIKDGESDGTYSSAIRFGGGYGDV